MKIILYIFTAFLMLIFLFISLSYLWLRIRFYFLSEKTKAYEALNKYITSQEFISKSSYIGLSLRKKTLKREHMEYDSFFSSKQISICISLAKKDKTCSFFHFLLTRKEKYVWDVECIEELAPHEMINF